MDLTQPLKDLVAKVPGAIGAVLIDSEGEAITHFSANNENRRVRLISAYHRIWLSDCVQLTAQMRLGKLELCIGNQKRDRVCIDSNESPSKSDRFYACCARSAERIQNDPVHR